MKALVLTEYNKLEYKDMTTPQAGAGEVLIEVKACGICGSDVHGMDGSSGRRVPPIIMGHEAAGIIAETGADVTDWAVGDRVTFDSTVYCNKCSFCRDGRINLCDNRQVLGVSCGDYRRHGAFAEYLTVPDHILYRLDDSVSFEHAAMTEALSVAFHAVERTPIKTDDTVAVVGTGLIGLLVVQVLRAMGIEKIIAVDVQAERLDLACEFGANAAVRADEGNAVGEILSLTDGRGCDLAFEVVGATAPLKTCIDSLKKGGQLTLVGNITPAVELGLQVVVTREITVYGSCASCGEYPDCLGLIASGAVKVEPLISSVAPLAEGASWFKRLYKREKGLMKVVLVP